MKTASIALNIRHRVVQNVLVIYYARVNSLHWFRVGNWLIDTRETFVILHVKLEVLKNFNVISLKVYVLSEWENPSNLSFTSMFSPGFFSIPTYKYAKCKSHNIPIKIHENCGSTCM